MGPLGTHTADFSGSPAVRRQTLAPAARWPGGSAAPPPAPAPSCVIGCRTPSVSASHLHAQNHKIIEMRNSRNIGRDRGGRRMLYPYACGLSPSPHHRRSAKAELQWCAQSRIAFVFCEQFPTKGMQSKLAHCAAVVAKQTSCFALWGCASPRCNPSWEDMLLAWSRSRHHQATHSVWT